MAQDLTKQSDEQLRAAWYDLKLDSEYYQDREIDHKEDRSGELDTIHAEMDAIRAEEERRFNLLERQAEENAYDRMVEA